MRIVLEALHTYLMADGSGPVNTSKDTALGHLLYLLGANTAASSTDAAPVSTENLFDGLVTRKMVVQNPMDVAGTPFSLANVDMIVQPKGAVHKGGLTRQKCLIVYYDGIAAFLAPLTVNSFLQPSSPFCCIEPDLVDSRLAHAPSMGLAVAEVIAAFGGVEW
jgi:hypothetical protein